MKRFFEKSVILVLYFTFIIWGLLFSIIDLFGMIRWLIFGKPDFVIIHWWSMVKEFGITKIFKNENIDDSIE
jgi:hypothetical protein